MACRRLFLPLSRVVRSICQTTDTINITAVRGLRGNKRWQKWMVHALYARRLEQGPEPDRHRSEWINWNYNSEIYAFGKRLGEDFQDSTIRQAFTHRSYIEQEESKRAGLGMSEEEIKLSMEDNEQLALTGEKVASDYIKAYLRHHFPHLPEEGIGGVQDYLMTDDMLTYVGTHLGIKDLMLCADFPPEVSTMSKTMKAVIGAVARDQGEERAQMFVQDFLLTQLIGKNVSELWQLANPMGLLEAVLRRQNQPPPEPRLLWQTGSASVMAAYVVGIYSDKQLIGQAPGETVSIAEEMAARNALNRYFQMSHDMQPFKFGKKGRSIPLDLNKKNPSLSDFAHQQIQ